MSYINVQLDTENLDTDELIEIVESRGYDVLMSGQTHEDTEALNRTVDEIQNLYHSFCAWKDGDKNERFEHELKQFFLETIDIKVI
jgi:hypothetical protein